MKKVKLNIHPSKIFYGYLYPIFATEFLFWNSYDEFAARISEKFSLNQRQWGAVLQAWDEKEEILTRKQ